jgi:hypothetical protein
MDNLDMVLAILFGENIGSSLLELPTIGSSSSRQAENYNDDDDDGDDDVNKFMVMFERKEPPTCDRKSLSAMNLIPSGLVREVSISWHPTRAYVSPFC